MTAIGELAKWFNGWEDDDWDKQMAAAFSADGRNANIPQRVDEEIRSGPLLDMP